MKMIDQIRLWRKSRTQLNIYYPKNVYDPLARKEVKMLLTQFNSIYFNAYPEALTGTIHSPSKTRPKKHTRAFDIEKQLTLYKAQKVGYKNLQKIGELLHVLYVLEAQLQHGQELYERATHVKERLQEGPYEEYFPQLYAERLHALDRHIAICLEERQRMEEEHTMCEQAIEALGEGGNSFWADTGRLVSNVVSQSVKQVVDTIDQSFKKK